MAEEEVAGSGSKELIDSSCRSVSANIRCHCTTTFTDRRSYAKECISGVCHGHLCVAWVNETSGLVERGCAQFYHHRGYSRPVECHLTHSDHIVQCCCQPFCNKETATNTSDKGTGKTAGDLLTEHREKVTTGVPSNYSWPALSSPPTTAAPTSVGTTLAFDSRPPEPPTPSIQVLMPFFVMVPVVLVIVGLLILMAVYLFRSKKTTEHKPACVDSLPVAGDSVADYSVDFSQGLTSGRGHCSDLQPRSLVSSIYTYEEPLGIGAYGEVYCGVWAGRKVAVKRFTDEKAFLWERDLMVEWNLCHPNLIQFFAADIEHDPLMTRYWLVTEYHECGSLQRYLKERAFGLAAGGRTTPGHHHSETWPDEHQQSFYLPMAKEMVTPTMMMTSSPLSPSSPQPDGLLSSSRSQSRSSSARHHGAVSEADTRELLRLSTSLVAGLEHLHALFRPGVGLMSAHGGRGGGGGGHNCAKPVVAHGDIKSQNVLIRKDGTCCIADYGHAVYKHPATGHLHRPVHLFHTGTIRYLAPERLDKEARCDHSLMSYIHQDVYSLGLVLWEIAQCCPTPSNPQPAYQPPFHIHLCMANPSVEMAKVVVCDRNIRPRISPEWLDNQVLSGLSSIMSSCWQRVPSARPQCSTMLRRLLLISAVADGNPGNSGRRSDRLPTSPHPLSERSSGVHSAVSGASNSALSTSTLPTDSATRPESYSTATTGETGYHDETGDELPGGKAADFDCTKDSTHSVSSLAAAHHPGPRSYVDTSL